MSFIGFKNDLNHVFINDELVILDKCNNQYLFFSLQTSKKLMEIMNIEYDENNPIDLKILKEVDFKNVLVLKKYREKINLSKDLVNTIDDYDFGLFIKKIANKQISHSKHLYFQLKYLILSYKLWLKIFLFGFVGYIKFIEKISINAYCVSNQSTDELNELCSIIVKTLKYLPNKADCLIYSALVFNLLSSKGFSPCLHIGVKKYDFISHAFVSLNGKVIGDEQRLLNGLHTILKLHNK